VFYVLQACWIQPERGLQQEVRASAHNLTKTGFITEKTKDLDVIQDVKDSLLSTNDKMEKVVQR
jgi:hypothetical protein